MKSSVANVLMLNLLCFGLTACSWLGGYFPNKEKDYQFSTELPPLKIPNEIIGKGLEKKQSSQIVAEATPVAAAEEVEKTAAPEKSVAIPVSEAEKNQPPHAELVQFGNGEMRLQINQPVATSWRLLGKALSRKNMEITGRDQANAEFTVQYDPNQSDYKDDSIMDEFNFVFSPDQNQEKPYHLKVLPHDNLSEVVVLDEQGKVLADGAGLSLLKLLTASVNADDGKE